MGLTHLSPHELDPGRITLDDTLVAQWPLADVARLERSTPVSVCWSPIVRCNLHCPQCLDDISVRELDRTGQARIAGILAEADLLGVDISGGEPLLLRDLPARAGRVAAGGRSVVSVTTNGWHLARRAKELDRLDAIRVSFDGPDANTHDRMRGEGSFQRGCDGVRAAVAHQIPVQLQTVLMQRNYQAAQQVIDLAADLGALGVTLLQMLPIGAGASLSAEMLTDERASALVSALKVPAGMQVRLRSRRSAAGFTVIRADGRVWRNGDQALSISGLRPLQSAADLALTGSDGAA
ncbi:radical SAM protein [Catellatospora citrea]|uniref:radical SAM protein n=1 Tax=Catellatospora citrea TaxID=53366 RepID=UPI001EF17FE1|nr:radical SAM protein [Catellatospora citrea]